MPDKTDHWLPPIPASKSDESDHFLQPSPPDASQSVELKVVGVSFLNKDGTSRQEIIQTLREKDKIILRREPDNCYDRHAILVETEQGKPFGHISRDFAEYYSPILDARHEPTWPGHVKLIIGGYDDRPTRGVVISIIPPLPPHVKA